MDHTNDQLCDQYSLVYMYHTNDLLGDQYSAHHINGFTWSWTCSLLIVLPLIIVSWNEVCLLHCCYRWWRVASYIAPYGVSYTWRARYKSYIAPYGVSYTWRARYKSYIAPNGVSYTWTARYKSYSDDTLHRYVFNYRTLKLDLYVHEDCSKRLVTPHKTPGHRILCKTITMAQLVKHQILMQTVDCVSLITSSRQRLPTDAIS